MYSMPTWTIETNQTQSKFDWVQLPKCFCESLIVFDYQPLSNLIVRLSYIKFDK